MTKNINTIPWPPFRRSGTTVTQRTASDNVDLLLGNIHLSDDTELRLGNTLAAPDCILSWNTTQTVDAPFIGLTDTQNTLILAEKGDKAYDFAHGAQTNPTLFIQSATQSATEWLSLTHNQTDGLLSVGAGQISIPAGVKLGASSSLYVATNDGSPTISLGSSAVERLLLQSVYDTGAQTLNYALFQTDVVSATAQKGLFRFKPDGAQVLDIDDYGLAIGDFTIGAITRSTTDPIHINTGNAGAGIKITKNDDGTGVNGPALTGDFSTATPNDGDIVFTINFNSLNSTPAAKTYGQIYTEIQHQTATSEEGIVRFLVMENANLTEYMRLDGTDALTNVTFSKSILAPTTVNTINSLIISAGAVSGMTTLSMNNQLTNSLADGTAPMIITSTTKVSNLDVDRVDDLHASAAISASGALSITANVYALHATASTAVAISHSTADGYIHLPSGGTSNQILKNSGAAGTGSWGTVTENAGALAAVTTVGMSGDLTMSSNTAGITQSGTTSLTISSTSGVLLLKGTGAAVANDMLAVSALNAFTGASGNQDLMSFTSNFAPTSGTATFQTLRILPTINQTGGANGTVTDILVNRTETALVGTNNFLDFQVATSSKFKVSSSGAVTISAAAGDTGLTVPKGIVISGAYGGTDVAIQLSSGMKLGWGGDGDTAWIKRNTNGIDLAVNNTASWQLLTGGIVLQTPRVTGTLYDFALETEWTTGTVFNADFASATVQSGDYKGIVLDFNTNLAGVTDLDVTAFQFSTPALTQATANTTNYTGFLIPVAGALVQNTLVGIINWQGIKIQMPNITQTTGTVNSYGIYIAGGTVTSGTELAIFVDSGNTRFDSYNAFNMGGSPVSGVVLSVGANSTVMPAGTTAWRDLQTLGNITELANATITDIVGAYFNTFTITDGGGSETVAQVSTVYIVNAPTIGTTPTKGPYALFVDAGEVRIDGSLGDTTDRISSGWFTDLTVSNNIAGSITGNAATVTNGVYTTSINTLASVPLATVTGIDLETATATTLYTVPAGKTAVITSVLLIGTTIDTYTVTATASLGGNSATYDDWAAGIPPGLFGANGQVLIVTPTVVSGLPMTQAAEDLFKINVTVGATATSGIVTAVVMGYLY